MASSRRIKVKGIRKKDSELSVEDVALCYWLLAKSQLRSKREREQKEKAKRRERQA